MQTQCKQLLVVPTESLTNRVWLEWMRTSKARLAFRYEISDLFSNHVEEIFNVLLLQYPAADHGNVMCDEVTNLGTIFLTLCSSTGARLGYH